MDFADIDKQFQAMESDSKVTAAREAEEAEEADAATKALEACHAYWQIYTRRRACEGVYNTAVIWLEDNDNGHMMCFTRGEYKQSLKDCISNIAKLDNPFCIY